MFLNSILVLSLFLIFVQAQSKVNKTVYSEIEQTALDKYRPLLKNILKEPYEKEEKFLITWLRSRNYDVNRAAEMLKARQIWRKHYNVDTILNETILDLQFNPYQVTGYTKEGQPMALFSPTVVDLRKLMLQGHGNKVLRYLIQAIERLMAARTEASNQVVIIADFHGFNIRTHTCLQCLPFFRDMFLVLEQNYPDALKYFVIINVPRAAIPLTEFIKPLLSTSTSKALKIFPSDRRLWTAFLLTIAEPDQLTSFRFGGKATS